MLHTDNDQNLAFMDSSAPFRQLFPHKINMPEIITYSAEQKRIKTFLDLINNQNIYNGTELFGL